MFLKTVFVFVTLIANASLQLVGVKVKQGALIGIRLETAFEKKLYYAFYGVPYARAPIRHLRFKDPKPQKKWKQPFDASMEYHGACAQAHIVHKQGLFGYENCLNLNIYTPQIPKNNNLELKPVIVWIHGYAFTSSFSHIHGPDFLIENDVLFVSVTHRIGVFGFLKLNDTDTNANMGLKDIIQALKWIRKNIKDLGGDKNKITLMGSGSAATYISVLLTTKYKKLFSKMILHSGALFSPTVFQTDYQEERNRLIKQLNINLRELPSVKTNEIIKASSKIYNSKELMNIQRPLIPFTLVIEKKSNVSILTKNPQDILKKHDIPILIGFNSQESITESIPFLHNPYYLKSFQSFFKFMTPFTGPCRYDYTSAEYKEISNKIKTKYFDGPITEKSLNIFLRYVSDVLVYPVIKFIDENLKQQNEKIYVYKFDHVGNLSAVKGTSLSDTSVRVRGAAAGDEICYVLKCQPLFQNYFTILNNTDNIDRKLIKDMAQLWANFAKTGEPSSGNINWPPITLNDDKILLIRKNIKLGTMKSEKQMFSFWEEIYNDYYAKDKCLKSAGKRDEL